MTSTNSNSPLLAYDRHRGPHPGIVAVVYVLLFIAGLVSFGVLSNGSEFPRPLGALEKAQQTFLQFPYAVRINAFFQFACAIPLGIFAAAVTSRLRFLGVNATGVSIAIFGGIGTSLLFMLSGLCSWVLSQPGIADDLNVMHAVQLLGFGCGGVGTIATFGLLMAGISVPCLFGGYTPKWLAWLGIILAVLAELSTLSLIIPQAVWLLPIVRFPSCIWMIGTGFTLLKTLPESSTTEQ